MAHERRVETVGVAEARKRLADLTEKVATQGQRVLIQRHGKPLAALVSIEDLHRLERGSHADLETGPESALAEARAVREQIRAERGGIALPSAVEALRELREQRMRELSDLR